MEFVCFIGNDRVGKSTMAKSLQSIMHQGCKKRTALLSFSDELRNELVDYYGLPREIVFDKKINKNTTMLKLGDYHFDPAIPDLWESRQPVPMDAGFKNIVISLRELFITHGTRLRRAQDRNYWADRFDETVTRLNGDYDLVVVDDTREQEDFDYFNDKSVRIYHLTNGTAGIPNITQDQLNRWVAHNSHKITQTVEVPKPLLQFTADKLNVKHVLSDIIPRRRHQKVYFDWSERRNRIEQEAL